MDGAAGAEVVESALCQKLDGGWLFIYRAVVFSNGAVLVTCAVEDGNTTSHGSGYFDPSQNGSVSRGCSVAHDAELDGTGGWWAFQQLAPDGAYVATYNDISSASDGAVVAFDGPSSTSGGCDVYAD